MNPCSVSVVYKLLIDSGMKMAIKDKVKDIIYTDRKNVTKLDVLKQQSSNFTDMMLGRYVSI